MTEREKVIRGLELCLESIDSAGCPEECPYYEACQKYENFAVFQPLMRDALELLKAQKPRVMTPEEIKPADDGGRMCWLEVSEIHGHSACFPVLPIEQKANGVLEIAAIFNNGYGPVTVGRFRPDEYNTVWRCWTERPTEEQRKAVKWE